MGLDPKEARLKREEEKAVKEAVPELNPPFPYPRLSIDLPFFRLDEPPPKIDPM